MSLLLKAEKRLDVIYTKGREVITDLTLHEIGRHTRINWWVEQGYNIRDIMAMAGHSNINQTEKYFGKVTVEKLRPMLVGKKGDLQGKPGKNQGAKTRACLFSKEMIYSLTW